MILILLSKGTGKLQKKTKNISVRGRLKQNIKFWRNELKPSYFVEKIISNGYIISFTSVLLPFYASNNKSSLCHVQLASQAIKTQVTNLKLPPKK